MFVRFLNVSIADCRFVRREQLLQLPSLSMMGGWVVVLTMGTTTNVNSIEANPLMLFDFTSVRTTRSLFSWWLDWILQQGTIRKFPNSETTLVLSHSQSKNTIVGFHKELGRIAVDISVVIYREINNCSKQRSLKSAV